MTCGIVAARRRIKQALRSNLDRADCRASACRAVPNSAAMRMINHKAIFAVLLLATSLSCQAQSNLYSVSVYSGGVYYEHNWLINLPPYGFGPANRLGLSQYSLWKNSNGLVIINAGHEKAEGGKHYTYTDIVVGAHRLTLPIPAAGVAAVLILGLLTIGWFFCWAIKDWLTRKGRKRRNETSQ
jgi:hypothetical protein